MINIVNDNEKWIVPPGWAALHLDSIPDGLSEEELVKRIGGYNFPTNTKSSEEVGIHKFAMAKHAAMREKLLRDTPLSKETIQKLEAIMKNSAIYPLLPGSSVFQMADPIRVFFKNPWNLGNPHPLRQSAASGLSTNDALTLAQQGITLEGEDGEQLSPDQMLQSSNEEEWYFAFTGYIATVTEDFDAQSNRSILRLQCEDIRRLLRYMRTTTSPNIFDMNMYDEPLTVRVGGKEPSDLKKSGAVSSDLALVTGSADIKSGMQIVRTESSGLGLMELLLFGDLEQLSTAANTIQQPTGKGLLAASVLGFSEEGKQVFRLPVDNNYEGQLTTPRVDGRSILDELYPILTPQEVEDFGSDWSLGQDPNAAPGVRNRVDRPNRLFVIFPDSAHFPPLKYPPSWSMRIDFYSEFRSRLDVINEFVQIADLIWYATPKGDIVIEFPSYDALPQLHQPPWNSIFTLQNEFSRFSFSEDDHEIKTFTIVSASATDALDTSPTAPFLAYKTKPNPELIARYGVREQRSNRPFLYDEETLPGALEGLTSMLQELANSTAYRLDGLEMLPNYRAVPGRAYLFTFRNLIGFCDQVSHQCVWGGLAQTVYHFKYIRHFDAVTNNWTKISGNFGWSWKKPSDDGAVVAGADFVTTKKVDATSADPLPNMLQDRLDKLEKIAATEGPQVAPEQALRLTAIQQRLTDPNFPPDLIERQQLLQEFNAITLQGGGQAIEGVL
jgi:hypothetical protein